MRGLSLPRELKGVAVTGPNLRDLSALAGVTTLERLSISSAVEDLDDLSELRSVRFLMLNNNERLRNVDALSQLISIVDLHIYGAPSSPRCQSSRRLHP